LEDSTLKRLKYLAIEKGSNVRDLIRAAIDAYLKAETGGKKK
jgi:hypothetical protein